ncbi:1-acyl-sn-glycerol-3-phosphate acyltransferase [Salibaculum halophilum]|uniref:1-acyl-sn-glycerol-3-phosphate acyltransferase n=1 Tax=Salibaculum halophilum TaxID=1914408 RepID=UPI000A11DB4B|nr:1-acyl-sn-glycerol-3-phosphate acyltransferase [Salibaculum halophilum]
MFQTITLPLWLFGLIVFFAAVTFASHFLFPSVRWFFRRRAEKVVARLNARLEKPIEPFKLARRYDMIQRLVYDPQVAEAINDHARRNGVPENVAFERARRHAREIVPSFSATLYFTVGARLAKWLSQSLYHVRVGRFERELYDGIDAQATVVFVMNHRSNMDYVLVTHLVSQTSALSYAVGEWARIWPLSGLIRMMGAYFIRRRSRGDLYRRVLARYVQLATRGGVTQAVFPEGGLSLTGGLGQPRLGILSYIAATYDPNARDIVFVPVGLNYDRVLEDQILLDAGKAGNRRFRPPLLPAAGRVLRHLGQRITGRFRKFGTATVSFGAPLSLREMADPTDIPALAETLMQRIAEVVPLLPVPLVAHALLAGAGSRAEVRAHVDAVTAGLKEGGAVLPRRSSQAVVSDGIDILTRRGLVTAGADGTLTMAGNRADVLEYYARSIAHHLPADLRRVDDCRDAADIKLQK